MKIKALSRSKRGSRSKSLVVSGIAVLLVAVATWFGDTPKALSYPSVDGSVLLNSHQSSPLFFQGVTLQPTMAISSLGPFLGLPAHSEQSITGVPVPGGTLLLATSTSGAIGNVNFLDQAGLVASNDPLKLGKGSESAAAAFPTARGAWVVTSSASGLLATNFSDTKSTINSLESERRPTLSDLQSQLLNEPLDLLRSSASGKSVGGPVFTPGLITASENDLWAKQADGTLFRADGQVSTNVSSGLVGAALASNSSMQCVVAATTSGLSAFSETQNANSGTPVARLSFSRSLTGEVMPVVTQDDTLAFLYISSDRVVLVRVTVAANCSLSGEQQVNLGTLRSSSGIVRAWAWNSHIVLGMSNPSMSFQTFEADSGRASTVDNGNGIINIAGSPAGVRFNLQFAAFASGFVLNDPSASQVAVVEIKGSGLHLRWVSRGSVASYDAQASATVNQTKDPIKSPPAGTTVKLIKDPACLKAVEPTQKIINLQAVSVMASTVTISFEQPADGTCTASSFMAYATPSGGGKTSHECLNVQQMVDGTIQCTVEALIARTTYQVTVAAEWGNNNSVASATESDPVTVTTINIDLHAPENVRANFNKTQQSWDISWAGKRDQASVWRIDTAICPQGMIAPVTPLPPVLSHTFGSMSISLAKSTNYFGQNVQFAVAPGLVVAGKENFAPATNFTPCAWTPPSQGCNSYQPSSSWIEPILVSGAISDSNSGSVATVNLITRQIAKDCFLGQAEIVYQYKLAEQAGSDWTDCIAHAAWQPDYPNPARTYAQNCYVGASPAAIKSGNAKVYVRYRIVLPNGTVFQDQSPGQRVAAGSLVDFSWPSPGTVHGTFSYVGGTAKNANALPDLAIALDGLLNGNQAVPDFSIATLPVISCTGTFGQSPEVSLGSINSAIDVVNGVPTVTISDNSGSNFDLIQSVGGKCQLTLVLQIPTQDNGVSTSVVLDQAAITPGGSLVVSNPNFSTRPSSSWFKLCVDGSVATLSIDPNGTCAAPGSTLPPGAIIAPEGIVVTYDGSSQLVSPDSFYGGSGTPPTSYTFQLDSEPSGPVSLQFLWTYLNTNTQIKVTSS